MSDLNVAATPGKTTAHPAPESAAAAPLGAGTSSWLDSPVTALLRANWETVLWVALIVTAAVLRLLNLGERAMSHDESLHTLYGYYLFNEGRYEHNPMMHGPFRFHVTALSYWLFGANDTTSRLVPALFGIGLVGLLFAFRRWMGRTGAFVAALLVTVSPSLLFHSRYIRDDIYIATWTTLWALLAFRYLETRRFRWLAGMVLAMAFSFVTMENSFLTGAVFGAFFVLLALYEAIDWRVFVLVAVGVPTGIIAYFYHYLDRDDVAIPVLAIGLGVAVILAILFIVMTSGSVQRLRRSLAADIAVLMVTLVLPFMASFVYILGGGDAAIFKEGEYRTDQFILTMLGLVALCAAVSVAIAVVWFLFARKPDNEGRIGLPAWAQLMAIFWSVQVVFFTTFFTNTRNGLASGIVGSLGYWLAQQQVERGSQPWYYYGFIGSIYEFLPIILAACAFVALVVGFAFRRNFTTVAEDDLPTVRDAWSPESLAATRNLFPAFLLAWTVGMWSAYTIAGEKMPWLMTHMALPMCLLGGWWLGRLLHGLEWRTALRTGAIWLIGLVPALILMAIIFVRGWPTGERTLETTAALMRFALSGVVLAGLVYLAWRWVQGAGWRTGRSLLGVGLILVLFVLNTRASLMLTFVNFDMATEYLVYAHATPDVKRVLAEIDAISARTVGDRNIVVAYDDESSWPFSWYMRAYPNARFYADDPDSNSMSAPVVIVGPKNRDKVRPYVERDYVKRTYRLIWWPDMDYFGLTWERVRNAFTDPEQRERLRQIWLFRRHRDTEDYSRFRDLTQWPARHEFDMWVRKDLATQIWDLNVVPTAASVEANPLLTVPEVESTASAIYSGPYNGLPLVNPRAVAIGPNGERVIVDTGNHRIVVLDASGNETAVFGSLCELGRGADGGCVDPDGAGSLQLGDGQLNEPWGAAVDLEGNIYVSDTWNGRIQVFSPEGEFLRKWGIFNTTGGELGDANALFGPRGIAFDLDGNLLVADTGNKRIVRFTPTGAEVDQMGGGGVIAGSFDEPTGVAVDPADGSIYVADAWNRRIQKFSPALEFLAEWPVPGWESKDIYHKPSLTVSVNGDVYATDPQFYRVFVWNREGMLRATFGRFGSEANRFGMPNGIAADLPGGTLVVADADNARIMVFPALP